MASTHENTVAILVPCYNAAEYLVQALDSAMVQTHRPTQIIIVEDGSTDDSRNVARKYVETRGNEGIEFILLEQDNQGEAASRNAGIAAATTTWIANLDADDWWEPTKLEKQIAEAEKAGPECVLVHTGGTKVYTDGTTSRGSLEGASRKVGWVTEKLLEPTAMSHPSVMYRREAILQIGGYNPEVKRACDYDMYMRMSVAGTFAFVSDYLVNYRAHPNQLSAVPVEQIRERDAAILRFFASHPEKEKEIGKDRIQALFAELVVIKLESLWWQRRLPEFRQLIDYADEMSLDNAEIRNWKKKAKWPNWLIRLKDRFEKSKQSDAPTSKAEANSSWT